MAIQTGNLQRGWTQSRRLALRKQDELEAAAKEQKARACLELAGIGAMQLLAGGAVTAASYGLAAAFGGASYMVAAGAVMSGLVNLGRGVTGWIEHRIS